MCGAGEGACREGAGGGLHLAGDLLCQHLSSLLTPCCGSECLWGRVPQWRDWEHHGKGASAHGWVLGSGVPSPQPPHRGAMGFPGEPQEPQGLGVVLV